MEPTIFYAACLSFLLTHNVLASSDGLTMELIHRDSEDSPFFQSNLSREERIQRLVSQSNSFISKSFSTAQPQIERQEALYMVKIGIGTFKSRPPHKQYYLEVNTGGSLVWMQCEGCTECFNQVPGPFPRSSSSSYVPIRQGSTNYHLNYPDGSRTSGVLAKETIYLRSDIGNMSKIENFTIGCGIKNQMLYGMFSENMIAGALGLGWGDYSFLNQIISHSKGKFSYCLPVISTKKFPKAYLSFGDVIKLSWISKTTPLYKVGHKSTSYYLDMHGISLNRKRLNISSDAFSVKTDHAGGCIIESSVQYSRIISPALNILKLELVKYFSMMKNLKKIDGKLGFDLCYERRKPESFKHLPDITFHFKGYNVDFVIHPEAAFVVVKRSFTRREYFCLAMLRSNSVTVIGAHQQTNKRIIIDTQNKQLAFHNEDCSKL